jgi:hypothetical protein
MIDIIGTIYTPGTYDTEGNELTPPVEQDGYHVNTVILIPDMEPYQIEPATPRRVFAGQETFCLKFADRDEWLALGYETTDEEGNQVIDMATIAAEYQKHKKRASMCVGPYQIRKALRDAGLIDQVQAFADAADVEIQEAWQHSTEFKRLAPMILAALDSLGIDEDTADQLFEYAKAI